jgi:uncharacterized protein (TIGR01777 family)
MRALVTGATGFIGRRLLGKLDRPIVLTRNPQQAEQSLKEFAAQAIAWDPQGSPPALATQGIDAVFHLAGEPVAEGRWTDRKKARIRDSRIMGTRNLVATLRGWSTKPSVLISASAVGYYGSRGDEELHELSPPGSDFLADVCVAWEREALAAAQSGIRVVPIRFGIVLGPGGALAKMLTPFRLGLGSPLGSGNQYMPWIHIDDLVDLMLFAANQSHVTGPLNGVSPNPVTNREFTKTLGRVLGRPTVLPSVPGLVLKTLTGDFAEVLLSSQRALPNAALTAGFAFKFPHLEPALRDVLQCPAGQP